MSIIKNFFDKTPDGRDVYCYTMENRSGMKLRVLDFGGIVTELWVADRDGNFSDIVGGYDNIKSYIEDTTFFGAIIGRFANRIKDSKFVLDGVEYKITPTEAGGHCLHGGRAGFDAKTWEVEAIDGDEPTLKLFASSEDGEEGFPGKMSVCVTYTLTSDNAWRIHYHATTDKPTIINMTNHSYFNLGGYFSGSILDTVLMLDADSYIPTDADLIPTGEIKSVEGTPFDFRSPKSIGRDIKAENRDLYLACPAYNGYDHCFNFVGGASKEAIKRGEAYDLRSGRVLELYTDAPCVQLYTGNFVNNEKYPLKGGYKQSVQTMFCLETQSMPDSINHEGFTDAILRPNEEYDTVTEFKFSAR